VQSRLYQTQDEGRHVVAAPQPTSNTLLNSPSKFCRIWRAGSSVSTTPIEHRWRFEQS
jgi:hypothetical protein